VRAALESLESGPDILYSPNLDHVDHKPKRAGGCLSLPHFVNGGGIVHIGQDCHPGEAWHDLAQQFHSVSSEIAGLVRQASDVAAWSREVRDEAGSDRIACSRKDDGDDRCRLLRSQDSWGRVGKYDIDLQPNKLGRDLAVALGASFRPPILDGDIAALG